MGSVFICGANFGPNYISMPRRPAERLVDVLEKPRACRVGQERMYHFNIHHDVYTHVRRTLLGTWNLRTARRTRLLCILLGTWIQLEVALLSGCHQEGEALNQTWEDCDVMRSGDDGSEDLPREL